MLRKNKCPLPETKGEGTLNLRDSNHRSSHLGEYVRPTRHLIIGLVITYAALAILDIATTIWVTSLPSIREANPLGAFLLNYGAAGLALPKVASAPILYWMMSHKERNEHLILLLTLVGCVTLGLLEVGNNVLVGMGLIP